MPMPVIPLSFGEITYYYDCSQCTKALYCGVVVQGWFGVIRVAALRDIYSSLVSRGVKSLLFVEVLGKYTCIDA